MPYPKRIAALASVAALAGSAVLLTAPVARADVVDVDYRCKTPIGDVRDPVFRVGTSRGVHAPQWQDLPWRGTVEPGGTARVGVPVELTAGAHGDCTVTLTYGGRILAEEPWTEPRPWGVTLFWTLAALVVPAALHRAGLALVDRLRPCTPAGARSG